MSGICYLVGTPIGNLGDITYRAVETLQLVDIIASEDTRKTRILLDRYGIKKPLISYHQHKEREGSEEIAMLLESGKSVALVSDAGMPGISDPGAVLVRELRKRGLAVTVVPGASAVTSAVSLAGLEENGFAFVGFLPEKNKDRVSLLETLKLLTIPLVFYCAPHDLEKNIAFLYEQLGERELYAVKEITKIYETVYTGKLSGIDIANKKGEFVLVVGGAKEGEQVDIKALLRECLEQGMSRSQAVKSVAQATKLPKNEVYSCSLELE
ncbi:MAG: 16S rRNA (cytidine(1402)-2'-O)-methyltransferase [Clostridia bacterium]